MIRNAKADAKTIRIRFKSAIAGQNWDYSQGSVAEWPEAEALRMIERGLAELASDGILTAAVQTPLRAERR